MAKKANEAVDYSIEEKIISLYELQKIDSKIDEINKIKGELPLEVQDLEDDVACLQTRVANMNTSIEELTTLTKQRKDEIEESKALIVRYEEQINNVRNNREFDSLNKEIEYQRLEIELCEKRLKEYSAEIKTKKAQVEGTQSTLEGRLVDLNNKKEELRSIEKETEEEMLKLQAKAAKAQQKIDERLLSAYHRIRSNVRNGLAVVPIKRDSCGGCYNRIPPQRQSEIRTNKKIIVCEYCGRILVDDNE